MRAKLNRAGRTDGVYTVCASNFSSASLYWSDGENVKDEWTAFAHLSPNEDGKAVLVHSGGQAVPRGITHVAVVLTEADGSKRTIHVPVPTVEKRVQSDQTVRFCVMSDLHLAAKMGRIRRALQLGRSADCVLLVGDLTNDGSGEQLREFAKWIETELAGVPVLAVSGNHDYPRWPLPLIPEEKIEDYPSFQHWLIERAREMGIKAEESACGAYRAWVKDVPVIGLNAASHFRRFMFVHGEQIARLEAWLSEENIRRRIVMCHAPMLSYNLVRQKGVHSAYLSRDRELQNILDRAGNCLFLSGHTHISLNEESGCVQTDEEHGNLYVNDSSVTRTTMLSGAEAPDAEWLDGALLQIETDVERVIITGQCVSSQKYIARAHYIF